MKKYIIIFAFFLTVSMDSSAQITFNESAAISRLMDQWIANNRLSDNIRGWRIQIITTADRREMDAAIVKFNALYPTLEIDWEHVVPYYKVKVGAYESKMDLMPFLLQLKQDFPSVIPIMDDIPKDQFIKI